MRGWLFAFSAVLLLGVAADAARPDDLRFGAWHGACAAPCSLVTPAEIGARLSIAPAGDGGLGVRTAVPLSSCPDRTNAPSSSNCF